jgi:hypothetical protein
MLAQSMQAGDQSAEIPANLISFNLAMLYGVNLVGNTQMSCHAQNIA